MSKNNKLSKQLQDNSSKYGSKPTKSNQVQKSKKIKEVKTAAKTKKVKKTKTIYTKSSNRRKKTNKRRSQKGCRCSKSKCLRLHCVCFRNGSFCGKDCGCQGCYNSKSNQALVKEVRKATKDINSQAFESRFVELKVNNKILRFTKGCSCSKNNCQKNYCECFKNGLPCTPLCKCESCYNDKCDIEPKLASKLFKKSSRKKKKIVFRTKGEHHLEMTEEILISKHIH